MKAGSLLMIPIRLSFSQVEAAHSSIQNAIQNQVIKWAFSLLISASPRPSFLLLKAHKFSFIILNLSLSFSSIKNAVMARRAWLSG